MQPKVSIIIPSYNIAQFIKDCLDSLLCQDYQNIEIIVINDGSNDNTQDIVKDYIIKDDRIVLINQINSGVSAARNNGIQYASGDYIMFVDGDDWLSPYAVSTLVKAIQDTSATIIKCGFIFRALDSNRKRRWSYPFVICSGDEAMCNFLCGRIWSASVWGGIYKRQFIMDNQLRFDTKSRIGEDGIFMMQAMLKCKKICNIPNVLYNIRVRPGSASREGVTYSREYKYIDNILGINLFKEYRDVFKLRSLTSSLYRTAFICSSERFYKFYDSLCRLENYQAINNGSNRAKLSLTHRVINILAKNKILFYRTIKLLQSLGYKPLL